MSIEREEQVAEPTRAEVDRMPGPLLLEFGASWCGHCRALAPGLSALLDQFPSVTHIRVEDGPGQPLDRSFRVKLWPTLVFMRDGTVVDQMSRPGIGQVRRALESITAP